MGRFINTAGAAVVSLAAFAMLSPAAAKSTESISAGVNGSCVYNERSFTVPAGQTATDMAFDFKPGVSCGDGSALETTGASISNGKCVAGQNAADVYNYTRTKMGKETYTPRRLSAITLAPGTYCISFSGGRWGYVTLNYVLVP